jgi:hypothetical protein
VNRLSFAAVSLLFLFAGSALSSPVAQFENQFHEMYGAYRIALFRTNTGTQQESEKALADFASQWNTLRSEYTQAPPPQYADDPLWSDTLAAVGESLDAATDAVSNADLVRAHESLEAIRDEIGALHARNNIETFSDRMNAYHAEMEDVLAVDLSVMDTSAAQELLERAAVLSYLAKEITGRPPPEAADSTDYAALVTAFDKSASDFLSAARQGNQAEIKAARSKLKAPYSKLFLKFG